MNLVTLKISKILFFKLRMIFKNLNYLRTLIVISKWIIWIFYHNSPTLEIIKDSEIKQKIRHEQFSFKLIELTGNSIIE